MAGRLGAPAGRGGNRGRAGGSRDPQTRHGVDGPGRTMGRAARAASRLEELSGPEGADDHLGGESGEAEVHGEGLHGDEVDRRLDDAGGEQPEGERIRDALALRDQGHHEEPSEEGQAFEAVRVGAGQALAECQRQVYAHSISIEMQNCQKNEVLFARLCLLAPNLVGAKSALFGQNLARCLWRKLTRAV